jgi:sugar phosphate isomerase/epimerase
MYKNLSPSAIGVFGRQSELVEIALTHRFKGLEIDITELLRRAQTVGAQQACRYLRSANMKIGGFELPIRWAGDEPDFKADLGQAPLLVEICSALGADRCYTTIAPTSDQRPFHENFQFHADRLRQVAAALAPGGVKLGLNFLATASNRTDGGFQFIYQADPMLLLLNTIQKDNVGLVLDVWHWYVGGGDVEKMRSLAADQIIGVRLSDIPADADLATITSEQRLLPGEGGTIDSPAVLTALDERGYDGPVSVSLWPGLVKGQTRESIVSKASAATDALLNPIIDSIPAGGG